MGKGLRVATATTATLTRRDACSESHPNTSASSSRLCSSLSRSCSPRACSEADIALAFPGRGRSTAAKLGPASALAGTPPSPSPREPLRHISDHTAIATGGSYRGKTALELAGTEEAALREEAEHS